MDQRGIVQPRPTCTQLAAAKAKIAVSSHAEPPDRRRYFLAGAVYDPPNHRSETLRRSRPIIQKGYTN
jgi:hypothetical protein